MPMEKTAPYSHPRKKACFVVIPEIEKKRGISPTHARGRSPGFGKMRIKITADKSVSEMFFMMPYPLFDVGENSGPDNANYLIPFSFSPF